VVAETQQLGPGVCEEGLNQYLIERSVVPHSASSFPQACSSCDATSCRVRGMRTTSSPGHNISYLTHYRASHYYRASIPTVLIYRLVATSTTSPVKPRDKRPQNPTGPAKHPPLQALVHNPPFITSSATPASCHHASSIIMQKASNSSVGTSVSLLTPIGELSRTQWPASVRACALFTSSTSLAPGLSVWEGVGVMCNYSTTLSCT